MKKAILGLIAAVAFSNAASFCAFADDLESLGGKWTADRTGPGGEKLKQVLEIKKNKFTFKIVRDGEDALYAEGDVKAEKLGPFKTAKFYNIQGGRSSSDLQPVDDDRTIIYTLDGNELTIASNFDKERSEAPNVTKYTKSASAAADEPKTLVIDKIVMHKTPQTDEWYLCFDASVGTTTKRFHVPEKTYSKSELTIATDLAIPNVRKSQVCNFVMKLDDVSGDECSDEMDNRSAGSFTVTDSGSQDYKPESAWSYTITWHLK